MPFIDIKTLFLDFTLTNSISLLLMYLLWKQNRHRYKGLHLFLVFYSFNLLSILLILLRGSIDAFSSIVLSNFVSLFGTFCGLLGLEAFLGVKLRRHLVSYIYLSIFLGVQCYFTWVVPNMAARNVNIALGFIFFSAQSAYLLLWKTTGRNRTITLEPGLVYLFFIGVNLVRVVEELHVACGNDWDVNVLTAFDLYVLLFYQITLLTLSFMLKHMINKRLQNDILQEEQKFRVAFHAVPYAILLTRKTDGLIIDVNDGFEKITGFAKSGIAGRTTADIDLWEKIGERSVVIDQLKAEQAVVEMDCSFRMKSGAFKIGQLSCINIMYEETECILSVVYDITEKKKAERELHASRDILKELVLDQQAVHENEKINLASQIDNSLNQSLAALRMNLGILSKRLRDTNRVECNELYELVDSTYRQTGVTIQHSLELMSRMRNEVLYLFGIVEAISVSLEQLQHDHRINYTLTHTEEHIDIDKNTSFALFGLYQEWIHIILSGKPQSPIQVDICHQDNQLKVELTETGQLLENYFQLSGNEKSMAIMKEKAALVQAGFSVKMNGLTSTTLIQMEV